MKSERIYKICEQKLYYLNYSKRTISIYLHYIEKFLNSIDVNIQRINSNDLQSYLDNCNFTSVSQQNQIINAWHEEFETSMQDDILLDWIQNDMNWEDVEPYAIEIPSEEPDYSNMYCEANFKIGENE
jgi:hypothetical protein